MRLSQFTLLALALIASVRMAAPAGAAVQTRTYQFTPDGTLPYFFSCGECAGSSGTRGDVAGTFTVQFDTQTGVGALTALDDTIVNLHDIPYSPAGFQLVPFPGTLPDIYPWYYSDFHLPWAGLLVEQAGTLIFTLGSTAPIPGPPGSVPVGLGNDNVITMTGASATFSTVVPVMDAWTTVTAAPAVLIPEPALGIPAIIAAMALLRGTRRRGRAAA